MSRSAVVAVAVLCAACAPQHSVMGRAYEVRLPRGADGLSRRPLLVLLHGFGVTGIGQDILFPFSSVQDEEGFIYALPDGTANAQGKRYWNATEACCAGESPPVDDVAFLSAVIADIDASVHPVDPAQVFLVGHSNGAFMSLRMACERSELIAGVVSVAGAAWNDFTKCPAGRPVSVLQVHGTRDDSVQYEGSPASSFGEPYPGAVGTTERFAARNGCSPGRVAGPALDLVGNADAETRTEVYQGCPASGAVELWSLEGTGHLPFFKRPFYGLAIDWLRSHAR